MFRTLLGLAAGAAIGLAGLYAWQLLGHSIFPFPMPLPTDIGKRAILPDMSFAAQAWVLGGYPLFAAVGGLVGNWIANARWPAVCIAMMVVGVFFVTLTASRLPLWMQLTGMLLPIVAGLVVASTVGRKTLTARPRLSRYGASSHRQ